MTIFNQEKQNVENQYNINGHLNQTNINTALENMKTIIHDITSIRKNNELSIDELKAKLAELTSSLVDTQIELANIQQLLHDKDNEVKALKSQIATKQNMEWESPYYWLKEGDNKDGPYCQKCYDSENKLIHLQGNGHGYWECKECKNKYTDKTYKAPKIRTAVTNRSQWFDGY